MGKKKPESELLVISCEYGLTALQRKGLEIILSAHPGTTQEQLAEEIGTSQQTISLWLHQRKFLDAMHDASSLIIQSEWPEIIKVGLREAKDGDIQWAKWISELVGYYQPKATVEHSGEIGIKSVSELLDIIGTNGKLPNTRAIQRTLKN